MACKGVTLDRSKNNSNNIYIRIDSGDQNYRFKVLFINEELNNFNKYTIKLLKPFIT